MAGFGRSGTDEQATTRCASSPMTVDDVLSAVHTHMECSMGVDFEPEHG